MTIHLHTGGPFLTNGYVLEFDGGQCLVIDAPGDITDFLKTKKLKPTHLLLTHQHFDHVQEASLLAKEGAKIMAWSEYAPEVIMEKRIREMGVSIHIEPYRVDHVLEATSSLQLGALDFQILHVPGHSPESIAFHLTSQSLLFAGDALFHSGIGRTDLPGGNHNQLLDSIREKLYALPSETFVLPGHGPKTTIGFEKSNNPFCPE